MQWICYERGYNHQRDRGGLFKVLLLLLLLFYWGGGGWMIKPSWASRQSKFPPTLFSWTSRGGCFNKVQKATEWNSDQWQINMKVPRQERHWKQTNRKVRHWGLLSRTKVNWQLRFKSYRTYTEWIEKHHLLKSNSTKDNI